MTASRRPVRHPTRQGRRERGAPAQRPPPRPRRRRGSGGASSASFFRRLSASSCLASRRAELWLERMPGAPPRRTGTPAAPILPAAAHRATPDRSPASPAARSLRLRSRGPLARGAPRPTRRPPSRLPSAARARQTIVGRQVRVAVEQPPQSGRAHRRGPGSGRRRRREPRPLRARRPRGRPLPKPPPSPHRDRKRTRGPLEAPEATGEAAARPRDPDQVSRPQRLSLK